MRCCMALHLLRVTAARHSVALCRVIHHYAACHNLLPCNMVMCDCAACSRSGMGLPVAAIGRPPFASWRGCIEAGVASAVTWLRGRVVLVLVLVLDAGARRVVLAGHRLVAQPGRAACLQEIRRHRPPAPAPDCCAPGAEARRCRRVVSW